MCKNTGVSFFMVAVELIYDRDASFFNLSPEEKLKYGPEILYAHVMDPKYVLWKKHGMSKKI